MTAYEIGWPSDCALGDDTIDPKVASTRLRHGNHDYVSATTKWDDTIADHDLPASFCGSRTHAMSKHPARSAVSPAKPRLAAALIWGRA